MEGGLFIELSSITYIAKIAGYMIPFVVRMKKKITEPRLGNVTFTKKRKMKQRGSYVYLMITLVLLFMIGTLMFFKSTLFVADPSQTFVVEPRTLLALVFSLVLGTVVYLYEIKRFYLYSMMLMLLFSIGRLAQVNPSYLFIISGTVIIVNGIKCMVEFIKKYPRQDHIAENNGV